MLTSFLVYAPVVALLVAAYTQVSAWTMPLFLVPALALQRVYILYQHQRQLTEQLTHANTQLSDANRTLENANLSFATALVQTLEESDRYTAGHSRAVANYARDIGVRLRLSRSDCDRLYLCGLVHDMGKIGLPPSLLNKEGRLTLEERREMEKHSEIGERILAKVEAYADVARIVRHHHERFDGQGYPDGIQGNDVPLESRIIAVADAYNAMTSDRPYRKAMDYEIARDRLLQAMGSQFFTEPVVAFLSELADADDDYRYARGSDFGPVEPGAAFSVLIRGASLTDSPAADAA
jgi:HD-GYP domain-containing protein (c-di-GMP phosphodiesterase class II)